MEVICDPHTAQGAGIAGMSLESAQNPTDAPQVASRTSTAATGRGLALSTHPNKAEQNVLHKNFFNGKCGVLHLHDQQCCSLVACLHTVNVVFLECCPPAYATKPSTHTHHHSETGFVDDFNMSDVK